jgi:hypothetical protein
LLDGKLVDKRFQMPTSAWTCPFCNGSATIRDADTYSTTEEFSHPLDQTRPRRYEMSAVFCPNPDCKQIAIRMNLCKAAHPHTLILIRACNLLPESNAESFHQYIPAPILADYKEACL